MDPFYPNGAAGNYIVQRLVARIGKSNRKPSEEYANRKVPRNIPGYGLQVGNAAAI